MQLWSKIMRLHIKQTHFKNNHPHSRHFQTGILLRADSTICWQIWNNTINIECPNSVMTRGVFIIRILLQNVLLQKLFTPSEIQSLYWTNEYIPPIYWECTLRKVYTCYFLNVFEYKSSKFCTSAPISHQWMNQLLGYANSRHFIGVRGVLLTFASKMCISLPTTI